ncbi:ArsB/NhaD family transporter [Dethiosulfovibrio salsuginis]|uniref:Possible tyrosine transporter P-protein n=1 Tax=Dethiosulfovibrio salsuginis TaxID=561720 RepID=A0A1X7K033_9BACT|nr:ArsB/NhaD family transporter [Dethiosulfovibrio salsuginis]SMG34209.1 possible tyrosine transporter P-protein [Dethiosulfovibrio salsuginis]
MSLQIHVIAATAIFVVTYGMIVAEKLNRISVALAGACLMLILGILSQDEAIASVDFNTLTLLVGMMLIVTITKRTGVFQYVAIKAAQLAKGDPWRIMMLFVILTAVSSALLDNVTTVLLVAPVTMVICDVLGLNPVYFLMPEILASNIGGTATLIGDPPNIMIGGATGFGFLDFIEHLAPPSLVILVTVILICRVVYGRHLQVKEEAKREIMSMDPNLELSDHKLLFKCLLVLGLVMMGFVFHQFLGYESATVALAGAALLMVIADVNPEDVLIEVEWGTIFFFIGLFILVGGLEQVGVIETLAKKMVALTSGNLAMTTLIVLWVSAIASAFIDNIPFVATMIPLIKSIGALSSMDIVPLWWALALGACLGGNGSLVGASANVIVAGMVSRTEHPITFGSFFRVGFPVMLLSMVIATIYLWIMYL